MTSYYGVENPQSGSGLQSAKYLAGRVKSFQSSFAIVNGTHASGDVIYFGKVPSNAVIVPGGAVECSAITGLTDFDVGLIGDDGTTDADILLDGATLATAANKPLHAGTSALAARKTFPKTAWQLAGYTADPGGMLDVIGTLNASPSASGTIALDFRFATE